MLYILLHILILPSVIINALTDNKRINATRQAKYKNITFKDYLETFHPVHVWEKIDKRNKMRGANKTVMDEFDAMFTGIDETDELLKLRVENGQPSIILEEDGRRRYKPPKEYTDFYKDYYSLRPRIMELIKQAIYQTRYRMVIMQQLRERYRRNSVYKMGFLMSKTDIAVKNFSKFTYKLLTDCTRAKHYWLYRFSVPDSIMGEERLLYLWFEIDLLIDLVVKNDENCRRMLQEVMTNRKYAWKFVD